MASYASSLTGAGSCGSEDTGRSACVWGAGPGTANPGELLTETATPLTREQAQSLAIDLSRRSTPAEGGFCTFQPVVEGGACPWNLDCHN
ncbi:hypothetical protein OG787_46495 [Streptomyces sp. NBC_00075]|uniref:hypothetical protein n=1 Tax=Streptomyces sp. NBC_00075 TaxID=2975641 RepID=UPI0032492FED